MDLAAAAFFAWGRPPAPPLALADVRADAVALLVPLLEEAAAFFVAADRVMGADELFRRVDALVVVWAATRRWEALRAGAIPSE